jgi:Icc protein
LLHVTDTHLFAQAGGRLRGVDTYRTLSRVLTHAMTDTRPPGGILVTGDLTQDETREAYEQFRTLLCRPGVPVWCLPGNHDAPGFMDEVLSVPPFRVGGEVVAGNWCLLLLNSYIAGDNGGRLTPDQLEWLDAMLRQHHGRHVLLAVHHHVLPLRSRWLDALALYNADELLAIIDRSAGVRCVVAGHVHQASDISRNGVRFLTTPSTCFQFLPAADNFAVDTRPPGYRWLDLMADGTIVTEVVWVDAE